jgi:hypothetical protein
MSMNDFSMMFHTRRLLTYLIFALAIISIMYRQCCAEDINNKKEEAKVRERVLSFISEVNLYGIDLSKAKEQLEIVSIQVDRPNALRTARCRIGDFLINVQIDDLKIVEIHHESAINAFIEEFESGKDFRKKTFAEMVKEAEGIVKKATGEIPKNLRLIKNDEDENGADNYVFGDQWDIGWERYTGDYVYPCNNIGVCLSEKYGLMRFIYTPVSNEIDTEIKISKEKALELAKKNLSIAMEDAKGNKSTRHKLEGDFKYISIVIAGFVGSSFKENQPIIIIIGRIEPKVSKEGYFNSDIRKARLSWPVCFDSNDNGDFSIYIDTKTGEYLGYEYQAPGSD